MKTTKTNADWLKRMADFEDRGTVSVGGWVTDLSKMDAPVGVCRTRSAFSYLVALAQRERHLSREEFALKADVALTELVRIDNEPDYVPSPRAVSQIARFLKVPETDLKVVAGLLVPRDGELKEKVMKFAARSTPGAPLTEEDEEAVQELLRYLTEREKQIS